VIVADGEKTAVVKIQKGNLEKKLVALWYSSVQKRGDAVNTHEDQLCSTEIVNSIEDKHFDYINFDCS
jgi:hypothetical protein